MSDKGLTSEQLSAAQDLVSRIRGISSCHISVNGDGAITEVHVVATSEKAPKLIARDVESCLKAELGVDVDYKKIGVVVVESAAQGGDAGAEAIPNGLVEFPIEEYAPRFMFGSVNLFSSKSSVRAEVELERDSMEAFGSHESGNAELTPVRIIAQATLNAISEFLDDSSRLCLVEVRRVELGDREAFVVGVDLVGDRGTKCLAGCSIISGNESQSVAYATLDAVNRVIGKLEFKSSIEYKIR